MGRVPTTWNKSEGPPGQREMLASSTIEQALRPLFPADFTFDTQVRCCKTWLSTDQVAHAMQCGHAASHAPIRVEWGWMLPCVLASVKLGSIMAGDGQRAVR